MPTDQELLQHSLLTGAAHVRALLEALHLASAGEDIVVTVVDDKMPVLAGPRGDGRIGCRGTNDPPSHFTLTGFQAVIQDAERVLDYLKGVVAPALEENQRRK